MKRSTRICAVLFALVAVTQAEPRYDGTWEALQKMPIPAWFDDGKIGIFIHWGPYSVIGYRPGKEGYAEHYPKMMYKEPSQAEYMKKRFGAAPPDFGYKDVIPLFTAEHWDPDAWASLFQKVGAKYVVFTAEHHDGWANWDSDLTPWNAMDKGPKRDLVGDLGRAVRKVGLKYAPSYHRERQPNWYNVGKSRFTVHTERLPVIAEEIRRMPEAESLYGFTSYSKEFVDDYVARWKEIEKKYEPDFLWQDDFPIFTRDGNHVKKGKFTPEIKYYYDQMRLMITDFFNTAAAQGREVYMNNKGGNMNWPAGVGCREKDNLRLKQIGPKWQSCTTFGTSFGYLAAEEADDYPFKKKSAEEVIHEMVEIISRNGNFLINIGPRADGTIPEWQVERLEAMGRWLDVNGEAIYGTRYWNPTEQKDDHLYFTTKGSRLYAIATRKPVDGFTIHTTGGWDEETVTSVRLLGSDTTVSWSFTPAGIHIAPPAEWGNSEYAWVFELNTTENQYRSTLMKDTLEATGSRSGRSADSTDDLPPDSTDDLPPED